MDLTNGVDMRINDKEGFEYNDTHTKEYDMWLVERTAPTPDEKEITEDVPFMQGQYDFSTILGGRVYKNRPLAFKFEILNTDYTDRKTVQTSLENWLMKSSYESLYDDHSKNYYKYKAKCESVETTDKYGGLTVEIEFDAYPFKVAELEEGNDKWDSFNFELDVFQDTKFEIDGEREIVLYNVGANNLTPQIKASADMTLKKESKKYKLSKGTREPYDFVLFQGENKITIEGEGIIEFTFYKELI